MMELADMRDLGSRAERRAGSTPVTRTEKSTCETMKSPCRANEGMKK